MDANAAGDSIVLEEEIDPNYEPTEKEVHEYASWLGMDLETEADLFWIAREGLKAPLPENWKPCKTTDTEEIYYFNFATGQSTWDHPCDDFYRNLYEEHKKKRMQNKKSQDGDEKKKKEKEDVAELLGRKGSSGKKKKAVLSKAEPLGPPTLTKGNPLEKKPLPGLSKLNSLSNLGPPTSGLKPVGSLGKLKSESKNEEEGGGRGRRRENDGGEEDEDEDQKPSPRSTLSKPPLGSVLTKKPLPSSSSSTALARGESKAELEALTTDFDIKKQKLQEEHARVIKDLEVAHEESIAAMRKKMQKQLEDMQDDEEAKLKQRRKELDKKLNDIENQFDKEESNLMRERKEKVRRLESDMDLTLTQKRQELERDQQKEVERLRARHEANIGEMKNKYEDDEEAMKAELQATLQNVRSSSETTANLAREVERLANVQRQLETQNEVLQQRCSELTAEHDALLVKLQEEKKQTTGLAQKLQDAEKQKENSASSSSTTTSDCANCATLRDRVINLETERAHTQDQLSSCRLTVANLEAVIDTNRKESVSKTQASGLEEITSLRELEKQLRCDVAGRQAREKELETVIVELKKENSQLQDQLNCDNVPTANSGRPLQDIERLRSEILELQDQVTTLTRTNSQIKEQLLKESNEKRTLHEQMNLKTEGSGQELSRTMEEHRRQLQESERAREVEQTARTEAEALLQSLRQEKLLQGQEKRRMDAELSRVEGENRRLDSELRSLKRQIEDQTSHNATSTNKESSESYAKLKYDLESAQAALKLAAQDKDELRGRMDQITQEFEELLESKHKLESDRDQESSKAKQQSSELDALRIRFQAAEDDNVKLQERCRAISTENSDMKGQLSKLKFKDHAATEKIAQLQDEINEERARTQSHQVEIEKLMRDLRGKTVQLEEKALQCHEFQSENGVLRDELQSVTQQLAEFKMTRISPPAASSSAGAVGSSVEANELRIRVSELETRLEGISNEKSMLSDKARQITQKQIDSERVIRTLEGDRSRLTDEVQVLTNEIGKWKDRLEKKTKDGEVQKSELNQLMSEVEELEGVLAKERDEKKELLHQNETLEKAKRSLESDVQTLRQEINTLEESKRSTSGDALAAHSRLRRVEAELETTKKELRSVCDDREALNSKLRQLTQENATLENRIRVLRNENSEHSTRVSISEDERARVHDTVKRLESQLEERDARVRRELDDKEALNKLVAGLRVEKDQLEESVVSLRKKIQASELKWKEQESALFREDNTFKVKLQQLESEREAVISARERTEHHARSLEKELQASRDDISSLKSDLEIARSRIKSLTTEKDDIQTALLSLQASSAASMGSQACQNHSRATTSESLLVKLQLADVNKSELEHHLADVAAQLELASRRCAISESRCKDQVLELESHHIEITSLRSALQKMHLSALETLPIIERLEYEHRKRTLRSDFMQQLRDFQDREEQALVRSKARTRAQQERMLEELIADLDHKRQQRIDSEEKATADLLDHIRREREVRANDLKNQAKQELRELESTLRARKESHLNSVSLAIREEEDVMNSRLREVRQSRRETDLEQALCNPDTERPCGRTEVDNNHTEASPGQLPRVAKSNMLGGKVTRRLTFSDCSSDDNSSDQDKQAREKPRRGHKHWREHNEQHRRARDERKTSRTKDYDRWMARVAEESELLDKAKKWIVQKRNNLKQQAEKIKIDKRKWKKDAVNLRQSQHSAVLREMKTMIDQSASNWNAMMQQVRDREEWISRREGKINRMRRALAKLARSSRSKSARRSPRRRRHGVLTSGSEEENSSDNSWGLADNNANDADIDGVVNTLALLDGELTSDASELSETFSMSEECDRFAISPFTPAIGSHTRRRQMDILPSTYRFPMATADSYDRGSRSDPGRLVDPPSMFSTRWFRSQPMSQHRNHAPADGPWAVNVRPRAGRLGSSHHGSTDSIVQRQLARWARDREKVQSAATKQATWLSTLYQEVKEYGDARSSAAHEAAVAPLDGVDDVISSSSPPSELPGPSLP